MILLAPYRSNPGLSCLQLPCAFSSFSVLALLRLLIRGKLIDENNLSSSSVDAHSEVKHQAGEAADLGSVII